MNLQTNQWTFQASKNLSSDDIFHQHYQSISLHKITSSLKQTQNTLSSSYVYICALLILLDISKETTAKIFRGEHCLTYDAMPILQ